MPDKIGQKTRHVLMSTAGYLTVAGVLVAEMFGLRIGPRLLLPASLLAVFAGCFALTLRSAHRRRRAELLIFAVLQTLAGIGIMLLGSTPVYGAILFFVVCTVVAMTLPLAAALAWCGVCMVSFLFCLLVRGVSGWLPTSLTFGAGFFAFVAFAVAYRGAQQAREESQHLLVELTDAQGRLRDLAIVQERQRLAREMHDAVGHRLTAAAVLLEGAVRLFARDPARAARMVETSRHQVKEGLAELRTAVSALSRGESGDRSVAEVLHALVEVFSQGSEAQVSVTIQPDMVEPDPERKLAIIRTAQEALTNIQKHAAASRIELRLGMQDGAHVLTCRDDGRGIPPDGGAPPGGTPTNAGFGLRNLRQRAATFGGRVELQSVVEGGTLLRLTLPINGGSDLG